MSVHELYRRIFQKMQKFHYFALIITIFTIIFSCSGRKNKAEYSPTNSIIYPGKHKNDISVDIRIGRKIGKNSALPIFEGTSMPIGKEERVFSVVTIENHQFHADKKHMFHIEWVNNNDRVVYRKYVYDYLTDSTNFISSSVSSASRTPGNYSVRVFYFRELIAEKKFRMVPEKEYYDSLYNLIGANLTFCRKIDKSTGERIGIDSVFYIGKKKWVTAIVDFSNKPMFADEMTYRMEWIDSEGNVAYNKLLKYDPEKGDYTVRSSFSLKPEKRKPGIFRVNLYFFKQLIASKQFTVMPEEKKQTESDKRLNIGPIPITLYRKIDKTTGEKTDPGTVFTIQKGEKVFAHIDLSKAKISGNEEVSIRWINPDKSSFFKKNMLPAEIESLTDIISAVSIEPEKRTPGQYAVRIVYRKKIVAEKKFTLIAAPASE